VADHPEAFRHDLRARLYIEYLDYVEDCSPLAVLMENVPDMLNHGGHNIAEEVCEVLESRGYVCGYTLLNAAHYGVPQMRERMFLVAYRRELNQQVQFPAPTNWIELPPGYQGSRAVALKLLPRRFDSVGHYTPPPAPNSSMPPAVSAEEAIGDLPHIDARKLLAAGLLSRGARRFDVPVPFLRPVKISEYAQTMRAWPRYKAGAALYDHVIRYLPRDYSLFARLSPGDQYPEAHAMAEKLFEQKLARLEKQGKAPRKGSRAWTELRSEIVPPYDPTKFPNKWFGR
jgi:DNA (cytosine-5)-methyltransferase 1